MYKEKTKSCEDECPACGNRENICHYDVETDNENTTYFMSCPKCKTDYRANYETCTEYINTTWEE